MHFVCNTVQLLQRCRLPFAWTMPPILPIAERIDYKTYGVIQQREYKSWVKKIEEIKQLVEFRQCTNAALKENAILHVSPEAQVNWCGIKSVFWFLTLLVTFLPKNIKIRSYLSVMASQRWDVLAHGVEMWANAQRDGRPAEYRWRPLFNAAVWLMPTTRLPLLWVAIPTFLPVGNFRVLF